MQECLLHQSGPSLTCTHWAFGLETSLYSRTLREGVVEAALLKQDQLHRRSCWPGKAKGQALQLPVAESLLGCFKTLGDQPGPWDQWKQQVGWRIHQPGEILLVPLKRTFLFRDSIASPAKWGSASRSLWFLLLCKISACANGLLTVSSCRKSYGKVQFLHEGRC